MVTSDEVVGFRREGECDEVVIVRIRSNDARRVHWVVEHHAFLGQPSSECIDIGSGDLVGSSDAWQEQRSAHLFDETGTDDDLDRAVLPQIDELADCARVGEGPRDKTVGVHEHERRLAQTLGLAPTLDGARPGCPDLMHGPCSELDRFLLVEPSFGADALDDTETFPQRFL